MQTLCLILFFASLNLCLTNATQKLVCYYNAGDNDLAVKITTVNLEGALPFCTHLVYGYIGINATTLEAQSLNKERDIYKHQFTTITSLKLKYPHLKVLLSLGGDRDIDSDHPDKYIDLIELEQFRQKPFINSVHSLVKDYGFDGLDLAYQFPKNKPQKVHGLFGSIFNGIKKFFTGDEVVDPKAAEHKEQFTSLVRDVSNILRPEGYIVSLTVLPNVNSTWYFDIPALSGYVDFVNLAAFDFLTPVRNPEEADYTAPLYDSGMRSRLSYYNVDFQVKYWLHAFPSKKINLGIASYGNSWKLTGDSGKDGKPAVSDTQGPASDPDGRLSYTDICTMLSAVQYPIVKDKETAGSQISNGNYAFRSPKGSDIDGIWISYEDVNTVTHKTSYVNNYIGGVALFDLGFDDYRGLCTGVKYPLLRNINQNLKDLISI